MYSAAIFKLAKNNMMIHIIKDSNFINIISNYGAT